MGDIRIVRPGTLILLLFFTAVAVKEFNDSVHIAVNPITHKSGLRVDSALYVGKKPLSTNPKYSAVFDSASNLLKTWPLDSITAHSTYSDSSGVSGVADTAFNTPDSVGYADSAGVSGGFVHGVPKNYLTHSTGPTTLGDSALMWGNWNYYDGGPVLYFGTYSLTNPTFLIYNASIDAGTSADINFYNGGTQYGYNVGVCRMVWERLTTGFYSGFSRFALITSEDALPDKSIHHLAIDEQTAQLSLNDSMENSPSRTWKPVWIKHGGLQVEDSLIIKDLPIIAMTDTVPIIRGDGKVGGISASSFRTGIGAASTVNISDSLDIIRDTLNDRLPLHGKADSAEASDSSGKSYHGVTAGYTPYSLTTSTWGTSNIYYDGTNDGINTTIPKGKFDISSSGKTLFLGADPSGATTRTDDNPKEARIAAIQYDNDEEGSAALVIFNDDIDNQLLIGGGSNLLNAATSIGFYTAANNNTLTGTNRFGIASDGKIISYYEHKLDYSTASRAVYLDADKGLQASTVTSTELGYLSGATSAVQTQLNAKAAAAHGVTTNYFPYASSSTAFNESNMFYDAANTRSVVTSASTDLELFRVQSQGSSGSAQGKTYIGIDHFTGNNYPSVRIGAEEVGNASHIGSMVFQTRDASADQLPTTKMSIGSAAITSLVEHKFNYATADMVAYFDADKGLQASSTVSTAELAFVDKTLVAQQALTDGSATTMFEIAVASGSAEGGKFSYTISASSGTSRQALSGECVFNGVNEGGTVHSDIEKVGLEALTAPGGSLTSAFTITDGAGKITINCNANSDMNAPVIVIDYKLEMHTAGAITEL